MKTVSILESTCRDTDTHLGRCPDGTIFVLDIDVHLLFYDRWYRSFFWILVDVGTHLDQNLVSLLEKEEGTSTALSFDVENQQI